MDGSRARRWTRGTALAAVLAVALLVAAFALLGERGRGRGDVAVPAGRPGSESGGRSALATAEGDREPAAPPGKASASAARSVSDGAGGRRAADAPLTLGALRPPRGTAVRAGRPIELDVGYRLEEPATLHVWVLGRGGRPVGGFRWSARAPRVAEEGGAGEPVAVEGLNGAGTLALTLVPAGGGGHVAELVVEARRSGASGGELAGSLRIPVDYDVRD